MKTILIIMGCILAALFAGAQRIHVPGDYDYIQQAINAALPGDTVVVADGVYYERLNFLGKKPLTVGSEYMIDNDENHIFNTIIDGSLIPYPNNTSLVYFILGEDTTSTLCGFTLQNGKGTLYHLYDGSDTISIRAGGAIFISGSGARIVHNRITHNHLDFNPLIDTVDIFDGTAIATEWKPDDNWVIIENNVISDNTCTCGGFQAGGAGICVYSNTRIAYNVISKNISKGLYNSSAVAGGFACATDPGWETEITAYVHHNTISFNEVEAQYAYYGGGLFQHVKAICENNVIMNNKVRSGASGFGGGIGCWIPLEGTRFAGNTFSNNSCDHYGGALIIETTTDQPHDFNIMVENNSFLNNEARIGGALVMINIPARLQNNIFSGNHASSYAGAILLKKEYDLPVVHMVKLVNNSFNGNSSNYGGALFSIRAMPLIFNCIFNEDEALLGKEIHAPYPDDTVEIAYSNIDWNYVYGNKNDGGNNINEDPLYKDPLMLTLEMDSPCLDIGASSIICDCGVEHFCPSYDMDGNLRLAGTIDLGAHELNFESAPSDFVPDNQFTSVKVYPNPADEYTTFEFSIPDPQQVRLVIFDGLGRKVDVIFEQSQPEGVSRVYWNTGSISPGIYFYKLTGYGPDVNSSGKFMISH